MNWYESSPFVREVLGTIEEPYPDNITDLVLCRIEDMLDFRNTYDQLVVRYGSIAVNQDIGRSVREITGRFANERLKSSSTIAGTYTRLTIDADPVST